MNEQFLPLDHPLYAYQGEGWVDDMLDLIAARPRLSRIKAPVARPGSFWLSVSTKRRATCSWASETHVQLQFTDFSSKVLTKEQLERLYSPAD
jgi:hypothetical protein